MGLSLQCRFVRSGDLVDIDRSISLAEEAAHITPNGAIEKPGQMSILLGILGPTVAPRMVCSMLFRVSARN